MGRVRKGGHCIAYSQRHDEYRYDSNDSPTTTTILLASRDDCGHAFGGGVGLDLFCFRSLRLIRIILYSFLRKLSLFQGGFRQVHALFGFSLTAILRPWSILSLSRCAVVPVCQAIHCNIAPEKEAAIEFLHFSANSEDETCLNFSTSSLFTSSFLQSQSHYPLSNASACPSSTSSPKWLP